jgi:hypothetical protein
MKVCRVSLIAVLATVAMFLIEPSPLVGQSAARVREKSSFAGTWEGKMNDLPGIDLKIDEAGGKVSGAIVFYYQERSNENEPWHTAGESPAALLVPHVEGKTVTFEVQHHKCHGARNSVRTSSSVWSLRGQTRRACGNWKIKTRVKI